MIKLKDVNKIYKSGDVETVALKNINLEIQRGEILVILGHSGSGKSTLLNVISGLDTPSSGDIFYNNDLISNLSQKELTKFRRENLGFIFQQYNLLKNLTVFENIEVGTLISKSPLNIEEVLNSVSMFNQKDQYPSQLSGGQQQRVSIARSIAKNPKIMFCDEPTGALDEENGKQVLDLIQKMNEKYNTTIVIITHNVNIGLMGDRIIKINSGEIVKITENKNRVKASEIKWA